MPLPDRYQESYLNYKAYPENIVYRASHAYPAALRSYQLDLNSLEATKLFVDDETDVEVPIRDLQTASGLELEKSNIHDHRKLTNWLGLSVNPSPRSQGVPVVSSTKKDPRCRFIYLYAQNSRAPLKVTRNMMTEIFTFHQVSPVYLDFISVFGAQSKARDLRFSGFREQTTLSDIPRGPAISELGRSGRQYQLCYNLKGVLLKSEVGGKDNFMQKEWSIRQAAIHHQFDVKEGTTLWIVTKGSLDLMDRIKDLTGKDARPEDKAFSTVAECFRSSLAAHLILCHWSIENWRQHVLWLERVLEEATTLLVIDQQSASGGYENYEPTHVQELQQWDDKINEAIMALESNTEVICLLSKYYNGLQSRKNFPSDIKDSCDADIIAFIDQLEDVMHAFRAQIARATRLVKITGDRKELVRGTLLLH
ncbi:MAG: hypothetical protein Q9160_002646 [Pyrenula sp. 1 TL-2023]